MKKFSTVLLTTILVFSNITTFGATTRFDQATKNVQSTQTKKDNTINITVKPKNKQTVSQTQNTPQYDKFKVFDDSSLETYYYVSSDGKYIVSKISGSKALGSSVYDNSLLTVEELLNDGDIINTGMGLDTGLIDIYMELVKYNNTMGFAKAQKFAKEKINTVEYFKAADKIFTNNTFASCTSLVVSDNMYLEVKACIDGMNAIKCTDSKTAIKYFTIYKAQASVCKEIVDEYSKCIDELSKQCK